jgi:excisionase family DNA binding protein
MPQSSQEFLSVPQAAELLNVAPRTVHNWIKDGTVPYVELPGRGERRAYRIPLHGLIESLSGNYDVRSHLAAQTARAREARRGQAATPNGATLSAGRRSPSG